MAKTLRVVVPPHPLIAHWLTVLRHEGTPAALYRTAMEELGRWLSYEALRDWLPHRREVVKTPLASTEGTMIETSVPLLAIPLLPGGLHLWEGARQVLPNADLCLDGVPSSIESKAGVMVLLDQIDDGEAVVSILSRLHQEGVDGRRLRVITTVCASPGLKRIGEAFPDITLHTACIDADLNEDNQILPGIGDPLLRLGIRSSQDT
ncbi:uracil phosphoribosyltransferase [Synechococcus sp. CS-197]|jgi:uracil phosphoribosyltransferase|uniref:uracil phosphoribosyltransferase n=1 Tax=Synechococcus sp. CS-197 TaxID=2847985 RepID=UPI0001525BD0|nr:uracil phosphoribosyltransferase [Synechococcus sp. CS-197]MCT0251983.1 uracil phosphoribosyltransferase [Synechococcus sp. CS-197]PTU00739.1 uracil phosphoribosyltransferase [Pseudomonas sp. HMWF031]CAK23559.1 Uracil phosphoribosyltransferase [Synechococcus sp. WH 7803]